MFPHIATGKILIWRCDSYRCYSCPQLHVQLNHPNPIAHLFLSSYSSDNSLGYLTLMLRNTRGISSSRQDLTHASQTPTWCARPLSVRQPRPLSLWLGPSTQACFQSNLPANDSLFRSMLSLRQLSTLSYVPKLCALCHCYTPKDGTQRVCRSLCWT